MWAPAGTPIDVIGELAKDFALALASPDVRERFAQHGADPMHMRPTEFTRFVSIESGVGAGIVKAAGITPNRLPTADCARRGFTPRCGGS
jgi:tripartite-type tricarboxylate transporter receptor subunit TctC